MKYQLLIVFLMAVSFTSAQQNDVFDTARRADPYSVSLLQFESGAKFSNAWDSSFFNHSQYNRVVKNNIAIQSLGDVSMPYINLLFKPNTEFGFSPGFNPYGDFLYKNEDAVVFQTKLPFTSFYYTQGKAGQQGSMTCFDALHTQNFGKRFNFTAKHHSTTNNGFYNFQKTSLKNLQLSSYFITKNERYMLTTALTWNKVIQAENGGINRDAVTDTFFRDLASNIVSAVPVELSSANSIDRYRQHQLAQTLWIKREKTNDTLNPYINQLGIRHKFKATKQTHYYTDFENDGNSNVYDSLYNYQVNSNDSIHFSCYTNSFELFTPYKEKGLSFSAGIVYDYFRLYQSANNLNYQTLINNNLSANGQLYINTNHLLNLHSSFQYGISGYNQNDLNLKIKNEFKLPALKFYKLTTYFESSLRIPDYQYWSNISNRIKYTQSLDKTAINLISVKLEKLNNRNERQNALNYTLPQINTKLEFNQYTISNLVYFNQNSQVEQGGQGVALSQFIVQKHFNLKKFQYNQQFAYQIKSSTRNNYILLPDWMSKSVLYYQTYLFKKALFLQIGSEIRVTSSYQANQYNPALKSFHLSSNKVGGYPFFDVFVHAEVKTARFYFKSEHVNDGLFGNYQFANYSYTTPYYPSAPRRFRLGVAWKFYY